MWWLEEVRQEERQGTRGRVGRRKGNGRMGGRKGG